MDSLGAFLNEIGRWPLLTPAQEIELARLHQKGLAVRRGLGARKPTKAERHLMRVGDRAGQRMVECNMRWVVSIAKKYTYMCKLHELGDLIGYGALGLQYAASKFDPERGYKFSTYARDWIANYIRRGIYGYDSVVYVPENGWQGWSRLGKKAQAFSQEHGRLPRLDELLDGASMSPERYRQIGSALTRAASLDVPTHEDGDTLGELLSDAAPEPEYEPPAEFARVMDALQSLPGKDRSLISLRYGLDDNHSHTFIEIAKIYGLSRNAVMERQARAERRLRESLGAA